MVRSLTLLALVALLGLLAAPAAAETDPGGPLASVEARAGLGATFGGGQGAAAVVRSPLTFSALVDWAIRTDPWLSAYGGVTAEVGDRGAAGGVAGIRIRPNIGPVRIAGGATLIVAPYTLVGPTGSFALCGRSGATGYCLEGEATVFVDGSDLPDGQVATQLLFVLGVFVDVL
jgi:hypothetical protein